MDQSIYCLVKTKLKMGWFEQELADWQVNSGELTIQKVDQTKYVSIDSKTSCQVKQRIYLAAGHTYYISFEVNVSNYVQGTFGIQIYGALANGKSKLLGKQQRTNGFERLSDMFKAVDASNTFIYMGSIGKASGSGHVGKLTILDLTEIFGLEKEPTAAMIDDMLVIEKATGVFLSFRGMSSEPSDQVCEQQFLKAMNKKCRQLNMHKTVFKNTHGFKLHGTRLPLQEICCY